MTTAHPLPTTLSGSESCNAMEWPEGQVLVQAVRALLLRTEAYGEDYALAWPLVANTHGVDPRCLADAFALACAESEYFGGKS